MYYIRDNKTRIMIPNTIQHHEQMQDYYAELWRKMQKNIFSALSPQAATFAKLNRYHREKAESLKPKQDD